MNKKKLFYILALAAGILLTAGVVYINSLLPIITGYAAKNLCSNVFISGRDQESIEETDLNFSFIKLTRNEVDYDNKKVKSRFLWGKSVALYRDGFGATLLRDVTEEELLDIEFPELDPPAFMKDTVPWPLGDLLPDSAITGIDAGALGKVTEMIMSENGYNGNAFAFMVVHKGIPAAEVYKPGFSEDTRFLSWSMAKSFVNSFAGIMVREGLLDVNAPAGLAEWEGDERRNITMNDLLQMQSGLKWNEDYGNRSDVTVMLHCDDDMSRYAFDRPVQFPAGTKWYYSSGTTNIVSYLLRQKIGSDDEYYTFLHRNLFSRTGIRNAVFEVDPEGTMVGSSYLYLTARDYARFGLLYLNDGVFNGERILPEGWVEYSTTPASASGGEYGAFFWLNRSGKLPSAPRDMYMCVGHDGQRIFIIPSREMVVVVLGYSPSSNGGMDFDTLLSDIIRAIKD